MPRDEKKRNQPAEFLSVDYDLPDWVSWREHQNSCIYHEQEGKLCWIYGWFLKKYGCVEVSIVAMTPTGFMTKDAWEKITTHIMNGI